ncbi:MAG: D-aminoacyl-tRNA deacylase [Treponema sp.]|jgi:D-tyrosyl-tRNA(Tyr) deacylase|nr:D-aminoacyl-tRNA deacylase [Treponema sp.]
MGRAVYFFCMDKNIDPVASKIFSFVENNYKLSKINLTVDGFSVMEYNDGNYFQFVRLNDVLSHNYIKYLLLLNEHFMNFDIAGIINWHEGIKAPDKILTVHSTGDVPSGNFGKSNPEYFKNLLCSLEQNRIKYQLDVFRVMTEATHWSGIPYKQSPELITEYDVPIYDIEIGSTLESWNNEIAIKILSESLFDVFNESVQLKVLLCVGGIHFEESYSSILLEKENGISVGHILANQWVVENYLEENGLVKLNKCMESIIGGVNGIIFHDNLKGEYKQQCRAIAEKNNIYVGKHKMLKTSEELKKVLK